MYPIMCQPYRLGLLVGASASAGAATAAGVRLWDVAVLPPRTLATLPTAGRTLAALSGSPFLLTPLSDSQMRRVAQNIWLSLIDRGLRLVTVKFAILAFQFSRCAKRRSFKDQIILKLLSYPYIVKLASNAREPHRLTNFIEDVSASFHSFWNKGKENESLRFIDENNVIKTQTKLIWLQSMRVVFENIFNIIGIDYHETM